MVADMAADMEVHMMADMNMDKVADMVADMAADMEVHMVTDMEVDKVAEEEEEKWYPIW